jgi:hypothetical protein
MYYLSQKYDSFFSWYFYFFQKDSIIAIIVLVYKTQRKSY